MGVDFGEYGRIPAHGGGSRHRKRGWLGLPFGEKGGKTGWWWFAAHNDDCGARWRPVGVRREEVAGVGLLVVACEVERRRAERGGWGFWLRKVRGFDPLYYDFFFIACPIN